MSKEVKNARYFVVILAMEYIARLVRRRGRRGKTGGSSDDGRKFGIKKRDG